MLKTRPPIWIIFGVVILWLGLAANIAYDYIHDHRITPFSVLFLIALVAGYALPKIFKWPTYTTQPSRPAVISLLLLLFVLLAYFLIRILL